MYKFGFIGMGNMGGSLIRGMVKSGFLKTDEVTGYDVSDIQCDKFKEFGLTVMKDAHEVVKNSDIIFIAVKPQVVEGVIADIKEDLKDKAIVSIVLNYSYDKYEELLVASTRHLTIMPNTPVEVNEGMILLEEKHSLTDEEIAYVKEALSFVGETLSLPSHLMGVGGALSGCAPAYIYMVIEALADGGVANGLPRAAAYKLASQTVLGSGKMQLESGLHPGILKDQVTSPAGSTIRGVQALETGGIRASFIQAINASLTKK